MKSAVKLMIIGLIFLGPSCKKKKQEKVVEHPYEPTAKKVLLPVKFESEQLSISLKYQNNTANIIEVSDTKGFSTNITYKNEQPYQFFSAENSIEFKLVDYVKTKENEPKARSFDYSKPVYTPTGYYILTYNDLTELTKIKEYNDAGQQFKETTLQYKSGNLNTRSVVENQGTPIQQVFSYDIHSGIFSQVKYSERLFLELKYSFFLSGLQNVLSIASADLLPVTLSYEYNSDDYPSQLIIKQNNVTQTFRISYTELKP